MLTLDRSAVIMLEQLLAGGGVASVSDVAGVLGCSPQALRHHVNSLNSSLRTAGLPAVRVVGHELELGLPEVEDILSQLGAASRTRYVFTRDERQRIALLRIGLSGSPTTISRLCEMFEVTRNTVLSDVSGIRAALEERGLSLESCGRAGYRARGDERELRSALVEALWGLDSMVARDVAGDILGKCLSGQNDATGDGRPSDEALREAVTETEREIPGRLAYNSIEEVVTYLKVVSLRNAVGGRVADLPHGLELPIGETIEYEAARGLIGRCRVAGVDIDECEQAYLAAVLLSSCAFDLDSLGEHEDGVVRSFATSLVEAFEQAACMRFTDANELVHRLLPHVRALLYRLTFRIGFRSQIADLVTERYRAIYALARMACDTVGRSRGLAFPDDEVACLSVYFGSWLVREESDEGERRHRILIVCGSGVGTSLLIRQQLQELLGSGYRYELRNRRELGEGSLGAYELVVATADVPGLPDNAIRVSAILTQRQEQEILEWSIGSLRDGPAPTRDVIDIVRRHAHVDDLCGLLRDLRSLFDGKPKPEPSGLGLLDVLTANRVRIVDDELSSDEAIRLCCEPLVRDGIVTPRYADKVIRLIDELGLYSELREQILVAHAEPGEETLGTGMSLTVFRHPVVFERWGRSFRAIFALAATDHDAHFPAMADLVHLLSTEEACETIRAWPDNTPEALYLYLATNLTRRS